MSFSQPCFHGLTVRAAWDGETSHAVDLYITFAINAIPNSRLRLIGLEAAIHADMTCVNENSAATSYAGEAIAGTAHEGPEMESGRDGRAPGVITDLSFDSPFHKPCASRIPLPRSRSRSLSPRKRPLPTAQRPSLRPSAFEDVTNCRARSARVAQSKCMTSHSTDESVSPMEWVSGNAKCFDWAKRGRQLLSGGPPPGTSCDAISGHKTAHSTPEQKVTEWLDQNQYAPVNQSATLQKKDPQPPGSEQRLGLFLVRDADVEEEQFPASPTPSSQAIVPWTSVRYQNPLRLRGAGSCAESLEPFNGYLYAVFAHNVRPLVHQVQLQAKVHLRKDSEHGGHLLELPGLPRQDNTEGCFTMLIMGDNEGGCPAYQKIAYVDKDFGTDILTGPQIDLTFNADAPFSVKFLCFQDDLQVLGETDFEIVYGVQTVFDGAAFCSPIKDSMICKHFLVCSVRLRDFLLWADRLQIHVFIPDMPVSILRTDSMAGEHEICLSDEGTNAREREVTVTMKATDITKPFVLVFQGTLKASARQYWLPWISKSRQHTQDMRAQQEGNFDFQDVAFERVLEPELSMSNVVTTYRIANSDPVFAERSRRPVTSALFPKGLQWYRNTLYVGKLLLMAYLIACYVTTQLRFDRRLVEDTQKVLVDSWTSLAAQMSGPASAHQAEEEQVVQGPLGDRRCQQIEQEMPIQANGASAKSEGKTDIDQLPIPELSLRDRIDRALGWKGPSGDW